MDNKTTCMSPFIHPFQFCRMGAMSNKMTRSPSQKQIPQPLTKQIMKRSDNFSFSHSSDYAVCVNNNE